MAYRNEKEHSLSSDIIMEHDIAVWKLLITNGWEIYDYYDNGPGYQGTAYINRTSHHLVISHRGTDDFKDLIANMQSVIGNGKSFLEGIIPGGPSEHEIKAQEFCEKIILRLKNKGFTFSFTGHSLGGWLATQTGYLYGAISNFKKTKVVTFDSPGTQPLLKRLARTLNKNFADLNITNYLSDPNPINTCNEHFGEMLRIYPRVVLNEDMLGWVQRAFDCHSMINILITFNEKKGMPDGLKRIESWPSGGAKAIQLFADGISIRTAVKTLFGLGIIHELRNIPCFVYYEYAKAQRRLGKAIGEELNSDSLTFDQKYKLKYYANYIISDEPIRRNQGEQLLSENSKNENLLSLPPSDFLFRNS